MTIAVRDIIDRVNAISIDRHNTRWPVAELLRWVGDGARAIATVRPAATAAHAVIPLAAGTRQEIPADGWMMIRATRNMGADGLRPGRALTAAEIADFDRFMPDWHAERPVRAVEHFMVDEREPRAFHVYPPSDGTGHLEVVYSASPPDPATDNEALALDGVYLAAMVDYVLYRAYSKDSDVSANTARAVAHYQAFGEALGLKTQNVAQYSPNNKVSQGS